MSVLSLSYWESGVYWRQNNKHFTELAQVAPQNGGKQLIWRNCVTVTLCIHMHHATLTNQQNESQRRRQPAAELSAEHGKQQLTSRNCDQNQLTVRCKVPTRLQTQCNPCLDDYLKGRKWKFWLVGECKPWGRSGIPDSINSNDE